MVTLKRSRQPEPRPEDPRLRTLNRTVANVVDAARCWGEARDSHSQKAILEAEDRLERTLAFLTLLPRTWGRRL